MPTIILQRTSEFVNSVRDYQIYIDRQKIGTIANGETKEFETTTGQHSLIAKIDWCSSPEIKLNIDQSQTKVFKVGGFKNGNWIIPIGLFMAVFGFILNKFIESEWTIFIVLPVFALLVYYITIGRKKYLTLTEFNQI